MTEEQDNAGEVVASAVRVALTAAGQLAEQAARRREADLREAERDSAARVATLQSQLAAERELALRSVRDVLQRGETATVEEVVHVWEQARSWNDPTMASERAQLEDRIRQRFGVHATSVAAESPTDEQATAAAMMSRDIGVQVDDAHDRYHPPRRVISVERELLCAGIAPEAAAARALAAESHPIDPSTATRKLQVSPARACRGAGPARSVKMQGPGR